MSKYLLTYAKIENAGDRMNVDLMKYFGIQHEWSHEFKANMFAIGGLLSSLQPNENRLKRLRQYARMSVCNLKKPLHVWGTGFIHGGREGALYRQNLCVHALRGEMSRQKLSRLMGKEINAPLCDAGLLARCFLKTPPVKKYQVGIIPHFMEQDLPVFRSIEKGYASAHMIDISAQLTEVVEHIAQCRVIISSSLHGLIFSDSLGIPNMHIYASSRLAGDGFKFKDYYSAFNVSHNPFSVSEGALPTIDEIIGQYRIEQSEVESKVDQLLSTFPKDI